MEKLFESICREKGVGKILEDMELDPLQESMQTAVNYIRAIVEVCPHGQARTELHTGVEWPRRRWSRLEFKITMPRGNGMKIR